MFPDPGNAPLGLKGWHVAFFAVGAPGLLMAIWVWTLKEPARGQSEGIITPPHPHPFRESWGELNAMLPPFNWMKMRAMGGGLKEFAINMAGATVIAAIAYWAILRTGSTAQWLALGVGVYAAFSWSQSLLLRDKATFEMIFKCRTIMFAVIGFPSMAFVTYGLGFWGPPFFLRVHGASAGESGTILGLSAAIGGWAGVTLGGVLADRFRQRSVRAKIYVGLLSGILSIPSALIVLTTDSITIAYVMNFVFSVTSPMWVGAAAATVNDLVMPRMRAIASAFYILMITFIGLALGPYMIGQISDTIVANGDSAAEALREGMLWSLCMYALALAMLVMAALSVGKDEMTRLDRARALGEEV
ncbi:MAG: MFS transporter [Pseudomonadales bacterium]|nr:MFS transporter [Pseudomonadales bacterium]